MEDLNQIPITTQPTLMRSLLKSRKVLLIGLGVLIVVIIIILVFFPSSQPSYSKLNSPQQNAQTGNNTSSSGLQSSNSSVDLIYGYWSNGNTIIKSHNTSSGIDSLLATLPLNIKQVTPLSPNEFLFINNTDSFDHGDSIAIYNSATNQTRTVRALKDGFGIDSYVISPNKRYLVDWEVQFAPGSTKLIGGKSRTVAVDIMHPTTAYPIYNETANAPVHYPRGVTNTGIAYLDMFLPNSGAGWAYGMSQANISGNIKSDIPAIQNGTYGTQPEMSSDGKYLVFAGYDGSRGSGTNYVHGFRQALVTPNTVSIYDTSTGKITKVPNLSNTNSYTAARWDPIQKDTIVIHSLEPQSVQKTYLYSLATNKLSEVTVPKGSTYIATLADGQIITGVHATGNTIANLGSEYNAPLSSIASVNSGGQAQTASVQGSMMQLIATTQTNSNQTSPIPTDNLNRNIHMDSFTVKVQLNQRQNQQSSPPSYQTPNATPAPTTPTLPTCTELYGAQCQSSDACVRAGAGDALSGGYENHANECTRNCIDDNSITNPGRCSDSPLYIYGPTGTHMIAKVNTPIAGANVSNLNSQFDITLGKNGTMVVGNQTVDGISYEYVPAKKIGPPSAGVVTTTENVSQTLKFYAKKLNLNEKETRDLVEHGKNYIMSPYVFVSFYPEQQSKQILPLSFNPKPDSYANIVFYFKELNTRPLFAPELPNFEPIDRSGNIAVVEISEVVEK